MKGSNVNTDTNLMLQSGGRKDNGKTSNGKPVSNSILFQHFRATILTDYMEPE